MVVGRPCEERRARYRADRILYHDGLAKTRAGLEAAMKALETWRDDGDYYYRRWWREGGWTMEELISMALERVGAIWEDIS